MGKRFRLATVVLGSHRCYITSRCVCTCGIQEAILEECHGKKLVLVGDGHCDFPGQSAKYCTYSFIDTDTDKIIHTKTTDKREVALKSPNMEIKAFEQGMDFY